MMSRLLLKWLLPILLLMPTAVAADSLESTFKQANNAFWNGDYDQALAGYARLEKLGVEDAVLYYNLGTAYARVGKLGMAVREYERAVRLDPSLDDARHNLEVIREFIARKASEAGRDADLAPAAGPWRAVLDRFSSFGAAVTFLVFHLALFIVLGIRRFTFAEMPRLSLGVLSGVLVVLTLATGSVAVGKWHQETHDKEAVVIAEGQTDVMEGPGSQVKRFALEEGTRVAIVEKTASWIHIQDSEGRDGWTPSKVLGMI